MTRMMRMGILMTIALFAWNNLKRVMLFAHLTTKIASISSIVNAFTNGFLRMKIAPFAAVITSALKVFGSRMSAATLAA